MSHKLLDGVSAVGASRSLKTNNMLQHTVFASFKSLATSAAPITAVSIKIQASELRPLADEIISDPVLAIGSTAERMANGAFDFQIANVSYTQAADAVGAIFSVAHTIAASKFGVINIYVNAAGTISSLVPGVSQTANQTYTTAALAFAAGEVIVALSGTTKIGHILIENDASLWTANTDDLTDASDVTTATFFSQTSIFRTLSTHAFDADQITAQKAIFNVVNQGGKWTRLYLSVLTGTGEVTAHYSVAGDRMG